MANNEIPKWLNEYIISNAYTPSNEEIDELQSQNGRVELIEKYNVVGEIDDVSSEMA